MGHWISGFGEDENDGVLEWRRIREEICRFEIWWRRFVGKKKMKKNTTRWSCSLCDCPFFALWTENGVSLKSFGLVEPTGLSWFGVNSLDDSEAFEMIL